MSSKADGHAANVICSKIVFAIKRSAEHRQFQHPQGGTDDLLQVRLYVMFILVTSFGYCKGDTYAA
jgi:hypothetical protein